MAYTLNQTVWVKLYHGHRDLMAYEITKLGRKWASLGKMERYRFDLKTGEIDGQGYTSLGKVYVSEEAYAQEQATDKAWRAFQDQVRNIRAPEGVTPEKLSQALQLLGIEPKA